MSIVDPFAKNTIFAEPKIQSSVSFPSLKSFERQMDSVCLSSWHEFTLAQASFPLTQACSIFGLRRRRQKETEMFV